ncbi:MAG TPA: bifunctional DNA-formamidopyrimidine glycosylase/DNA-(apurinic or apyrimidinic site) lyase [Terriglobales bacterium]|nr:bifunctional DNA-formamidopyrimidine glycosylase/DNA-(apurinic or apyrimidinic site) lyase [Terriglobales bacterium]
MPELPEVETIARGLRSALLGRRIAAIAHLRKSIYSGPASHIESAKVAAIERAGKYLVLSLHTGKKNWQLMIHLGMTGQVLIVPACSERARHTHAVFILDDTREIHFRDPRRFGRIALAAAPAQGFAPSLGIAPGAEPLEVTPDVFVALFRGRNAPIKSALLNQSLLRGVGNIYADEALFRAAIHPRARNISKPRLLRLRNEIRAVLNAAIAAGGSSISDYVDSGGNPGAFHFQHQVYARTGEPCATCATPIRRIVLAGRSSHFCPRCQPR